MRAVAAAWSAPAASLGNSEERNIRTEKSARQRSSGGRPIRMDRRAAESEDENQPAGKNSGGGSTRSDQHELQTCEEKIT